MRIAVIGAGVGGYFGGCLAAAGCDVTFVAQGAHLESIRKNGLRITSPLGGLTLETENAVDDIAKVGSVDLVIVGVKLWNTEQVASALKPLADQGAAVVSFQNGMHKDEILRRYGRSCGRRSCQRGAVSGRLCRRPTHFLRHAACHNDLVHAS